MRTHSTVVALMLALGAVGCKKDDKPTKLEEALATLGSGTHGAVSTMAGSGGGSATAAPAQDIDSKDILVRADTTPEVTVKHVLISWKELAPAFRGHQDPRGAARTNAEAAQLAQDTAAKLKAAPDQIDALVKELGEDPGSLSGDPYTVNAESQFVPDFKKLALRLKLNEVGIVKTSYGYHVMERITPPPPDPLESADILARPAGTSARVQHILLGWKDLASAKRDPRAQKRTKAEADKLAKETLDKLTAGGDMAALMKEVSEDASSKDNAKVIEITPATQILPPFKNLALRLKVGEAGMVKTPFGWHIIKRIPPPPPDPLESTDILAREPVTKKAKVKHILLAWKDVQSPQLDPRAKARDRATLEKLVKDTVAKLKGGAKIEELMASESEDPGSAKDGKSYDVSPDASLVEPFKALSLRLNLNEVGVVKTDFGIHIIKRVE
jgi:parvulin-like peptidyl-prolyl isomerase